MQHRDALQMHRYADSWNASGVWSVSFTKFVKLTLSQTAGLSGSKRTVPLTYCLL